MIKIYVQRKWLNTIGGTVDRLCVFDENEESDYVSLLAGKATVGSLFVDAQLARRGAADGDDPFIPAHIPVSVVSGIFDLTRVEAGQKYGFQTE